MKGTRPLTTCAGLAMAPALWLAGAIVIAQQAAPVADPAVQGRIVAEGSSAPLARARVTVLSNDGSRAPVFSDADGRFVATVPAGGTFRLRVAKAGFITRELTAARSPTAVTEVVLTRGAVVWGRVVSADGEPVTNASIFVRPAGSPTLASGAASATTDDLGEFRVVGLLAGRYLVSSSPSMVCRNEANLVQCISTPPGTQEVDLRPGDETTANVTVQHTDFGGPLTNVSVGPDRAGTIDINTIRGNTGSTAPPAGVVRGRVTANGAPVAGISVTLSGRTSNGIDVTMLGSVTDAQGRYEIREVPAGQLRVSAGRAGSFLSTSLAGSPQGSTILLAEGEQVDNVNLSIARRSVITGRIVDEAGEPIEGLTVRALSARFVDGRLRLDNVPGAAVRTTDDRGQYRIFGLLPGSYHIVVSDAPAPVIPGGPPVHASLQVFYPGRTSAAEALPLQVDAEAVVAGIDLMFAPHQGGRVLGHAQLSSGRPFSGTAVLVHSARTGALASEPRAVPIQDGRFEFLHVAPGDYIVQAAAWKTWEVSEEFGAAPVRVGGQETAAVNITTTPPSTLSGTIRLEGGSASLSDFRLRTLPADPDFTLALPSVEPALAERVDVRADGRFTITGLAGPRRITASAPAGWWLKSAVIDGIDATDDPFVFGPGAARRTNVDVVFASGAVTISGRVTNSRAEPMAGYPVMLFPADASRIYPGSRYLGMTHSDRQGRFSLPDFPPGDYAVVAVDAALQGDDWQDPGVLNALAGAARRVTARQGARTTVDLQPVPLSR